MPEEFAARVAFHVGRAANHLGEFERALVALKTAVDGKVPKACGELARTLIRTGHMDEAAAVAREGLARDPFDIKSLRVLGSVLIQRGEAGSAYDIAQSLFSKGVRTGQLLWNWADAARVLGGDAEFADLVSRESWFSETRPEEDDAFNAALAEEILSNEALIASNSYKPARSGVLRFDDFGSSEEPLAQSFHTMIRREISRYLGERAQHCDHPVVAGWPNAVEMESWALAMDRSGFEDWHLHAAAWLSGVYYVRAPALDGDAGCIGFGALPGSFQTHGPLFPEWKIRPRPGLLILFPSHFAHRTWPTSASGERISIAFNAVQA